MTTFFRVSLILTCLIGCASWGQAATTVLPSDRQPTIGIGVSPMIIDYTFGNQQKNATTIIDIESAMGQLYHVDPLATDLVQDADGTLLPADAGAHPTSCAQWLQFDQSRMTLPVRGKLQFTVTVTRPPRTTGTHLCGVRLVAIPAELPTNASKDKATTLPGTAQLSFTYTVVIKVSLPGTIPVPKLAFDQVHLIGEPPYPSVEVLVHNISDTGFPLSLSAELRQRDSGSNVRIPLLIQRGHDYVTTHTLWPDGAAHAVGRVPMPIPPGAYTLTVRAVAQRRVIQHAVEVTVPTSESAELAWHDPIKPLVLKPTQKQTTTFNLYNLTDMTLSPVLSVAPLHPGLCRDWTVDVSPIDGPIAPHSYRRVQAILTAGPTTPSTCALSVIARTSQNSVSTRLIASTPLSATPPVVTLHPPIYTQETNELSVSVLNNSELPAFFSSWTTFLTSGPRHLPVGHWTQETPRPVIPGVKHTWTIPMSTPLTPGVYTVRMMGFWKERTIILGEQELIVSGQDSLNDLPPRSR